MSKGNKKTTIINLFGGAGCGKSTLAAGIFEALKMKHKNVELVTEFIKKWAHEGKFPKWSDQAYILGNQMREESVLYGKADVIITDSPIWLPAFYQKKFNNKNSMEIAVRNIVKEIEDEGIEYVHFWLEKIDQFQTEGRFQTKEEAHELHDDLKEYLENTVGLKLISMPADHETRKKMIIKEIERIKGW